MENCFGFYGGVLLNYLMEYMHRGINFSSSDIKLNIFWIHDAFGEVLAVDGSMKVVGFAVEVAFVLEDMEEGTDISIRITLAFEANSGNEIALVISISGFGEEALGGELELFFK